MALDFPSSPTNNQVYENYIYSASSGAWQKLPGNTFATTAISDTPPVNPANGDLWWSSADGKFYIYYSDGSSSQWVSAAALPAVAISDTPPAGYDGQMWLDSTDGSMYVYYTDPGGASSSWIGAVSRSGGILQVVSTTKTDVFSTSSPSFVDIPGLSASITPRSTSSKILVTTSIQVSESVSNANVEMILVRDGSRIPTSAPSNQFSLLRGTGDASDVYNYDLNFLDSPSSTSSLTYGVKILSDAGTVYINRQASVATRTFISTITLLEVAG